MKKVAISCDICGKTLSIENFHNENEGKNKLTMGNEILSYECCDSCSRNIRNYINNEKTKYQDKDNFNFERN